MVDLSLSRLNYLTKVWKDSIPACKHTHTLVKSGSLTKVSFMHFLFDQKRGLKRECEKTRCDAQIEAWKDSLVSRLGTPLASEWCRIKGNPKELSHHRLGSSEKILVSPKVLTALQGTFVGGFVNGGVGVSCHPYGKYDKWAFFFLIWKLQNFFPYFSFLTSLWNWNLSFSTFPHEINSGYCLGLLSGMGSWSVFPQVWCMLVGSEPGCDPTEFLHSNGSCVECLVCGPGEQLSEVTTLEHFFPLQRSFCCHVEWESVSMSGLRLRGRWQSGVCAVWGEDIQHRHWCGSLQKMHPVLFAQPSGGWGVHLQQGCSVWAVPPGVRNIQEQPVHIITVQLGHRVFVPVCVKCLSLHRYYELKSITGEKELPCVPCHNGDIAHKYCLHLTAQRTKAGNANQRVTDRTLITYVCGTDSFPEMYSYSCYSLIDIAVTVQMGKFKVPQEKSESLYDLSCFILRSSV